MFLSYLIDVSSTTPAVHHEIRELAATFIACATMNCAESALLTFSKLTLNQADVHERFCWLMTQTLAFKFLSMTNTFNHKTCCTTALHTLVSQ